MAETGVLLVFCVVAFFLLRWLIQGAILLLKKRATVTDRKGFRRPWWSVAADHLAGDGTLFLRHASDTGRADK